MKRKSVRTTTLAVATSAFVTSLTMPTVVRILRKLDQFDRPNCRSSHSAPTLRGGGLACVAGTLAGVSAVRIAGSRASAVATGGVLSLAAIGYFDDRKGLSAVARLGGQLAVGAVGGALLGRTLSAGIVGTAVVPAVVNSFNFMDGINGISAGQVVVWAGAAIPQLSKMESSAELPLVASALGASLSFLPWNVPDARVFLGDVGSYLFGSIIAFSSLSAAIRDRRALIPLAAPYAVYLADTGWTLIRRARAGEALTAAHRDHVYQALSDVEGVKHWHVAAGVSTVSALSAVLSRNASTSAGIPLLLAAYLASPSVVRWARERKAR